MAKNSKDRAQKPKATATALAAAGSENEEEVPVLEPPLVPGCWKDHGCAAGCGRANKATGSARAASMTWDESRRRYGGQTMGSNWEQLPRPPIEGAYVNEGYPTPEKSEAEEREDEKAEARAKLQEKEYQEEQRKQAERRRNNKANRPPKEKRVDHAKVARVAYDRRMLDTTIPSSSGWGPYSSGPPTPSSGGWGTGINPSGLSLVVTDVQHPRITCMDRTFLANAQRMGGEWRRSAVRWIPSTDRSLLKATCTYVWRVPVEQLSEDDYRDHIMEIVGQPATKGSPTKHDQRLVSFMERVDDVIDENGLRQLLKDSTMLRTFVKVVAARVTPSYLRDRVEEKIEDRAGE
ncbi:hypothetical protein H257_02849 [Aphanomyces astaci]|uniref:Uncharacterized protein n=1 Tax=Aphanomyces astaci TaxID=112090 RepID=W4H1C0_APHAT|nr:hypothetical protein H257_02849 [Aphanomyces astaci]ETV84953.1 hypothetical protein H257_02849 [Aphanomyces astaci]|eukprot:XP_009824971.1 hypothetical protein H257_02849 [Aphanomyces astaci]